MVTQEGGNVSVVAVRGNFDDTQTGVKSIFNDKNFNVGLNDRGFKLSSANSINWGRLLPQIVYYFSAYADMIKDGRVVPGQKVNFVVPTGNFGNILAGYYAKLMGLPVNRLICAANSNNVLTEFLRTGVYNRIRDFHKTLSPSMDILISSNLERLLYHISGGDTAKVAGWMHELSDKGSYQIGAEGLQTIQETFWSDWVADPHTAVAWRVYDNYRRDTGDETSTVIISTASPFKFSDSVLAAIAGKGALCGKSGFAVLRELSGITNWPIPPALAELELNEPRHHRVCDKEEMPDLVKNLLE
jgi:threonine synthase